MFIQQTIGLFSAPLRHSNTLQQLSNGVRVSPPPSDWHCAAEGCPVRRDNLWLNLTDGSLFCGRQQVGGLEGYGHALSHFDRTHYPLVVKMGTITPAGAGTSCSAASPTRAWHSQHSSLVHSLHICRCLFVRRGRDGHRPEPRAAPLAFRHRHNENGSGCLSSLLLVDSFLCLLLLPSLDASDIFILSRL